MLIKPNTRAEAIAFADKMIDYGADFHVTTPELMSIADSGRVFEYWLDSELANPKGRVTLADETEDTMSVNRALHEIIKPDITDITTWWVGMQI